jgi:hypothetical protein
VEGIGIWLRFRFRLDTRLLMTMESRLGEHVLNSVYVLVTLYSSRFIRCLILLVYYIPPIHIEN